MTEERLRQIIINDDDFKFYLGSLNMLYEVDLSNSKTSIAGSSSYPYYDKKNIGVYFVRCSYNLNIDVECAA